MVRLSAFASCLVAAACAPVDPGSSDDLSPPEVTLTTPASGAQLGFAAVVEVRGRAVDLESGVRSVTVNGHAAQLAGDEFFLLLPVTPGITLIVATAENGAKVTGQAARGVMTGETAPLDGFVADGLHVAISNEALNAIAQVAATFIADTDLTTMIAPMNPVFSSGNSDGNGDCLYVDANLIYLEVDSAQGVLRSDVNALTLTATFDHVAAQAYLQYAASCLDGTRTINVGATRMTVTATLSPVVADGRVTLVTRDITATFDGAFMDVGGLTQEVVNLFGINDLFAPLATYAAEAVLPDLLNQTLDSLSTTRRVALLGQEMDLQFWPSGVVLSAGGLEVAVDSNVSVIGADPSKGYVAIPHVPTVGTTPGAFAVDVAADLLNQAMTGFWAAGGAQQTIPFGVTHEALGLVFDRIEIEARLPPFASINHAGEAQIAVADLRALFRNGDAVVADASISAQVAMSASFDGTNVRLAPGDVEVYVELAQAGVVGGNTLSTPQFETLLSFASEQAVRSLGGVLEGLPLPAAQLPIAEARIGGKAGYISLEGMVR